MKRYFCFLLLAVLALVLLASCEKNEAVPYGTGPHEDGTEAPETVYDFSYHVMDGNCDFFETEDGFYYLNNQSGLIYYSEKENIRFHILCNKPDCGHTGADCNAYAGLHMGYYNGKIYAVTKYIPGTGSEIIQMNPDGTGHARVCDTPNARIPGETKESGGGMVYFHAGYFINFIHAGSSPVNPGYPVLVTVNLETGKAAQVTTGELIGYNPLISQVYPDGECFWFRAYQTETKTWDFYCLDLKKGKLTAHALPDGVSPDAVRDGKVYFYKSGTEYWNYNLSTGEEQQVKQLTTESFGRYLLEKYLFEINPFDGEDFSRLTVLDMSGQTVAEAEMKAEDGSKLRPVAISRDNQTVFFSSDPTSVFHVTHVLRLNRLQDGAVTIETIGAG